MIILCFFCFGLSDRASLLSVWIVPKKVWPAFYPANTTVLVTTEKDVMDIGLKMSENIKAVKDTVNPTNATLDTAENRICQLEDCQSR